MKFFPIHTRDYKLCELPATDLLLRAVTLGLAFDRVRPAHGGVLIFRVRRLVLGLFDVRTYPIGLFAGVGEVVPDVSSNTRDLAVVAFNAILLHFLTLVELGAEDDESVAGTRDMLFRSFACMGRARGGSERRIWGGVKEALSARYGIRQLIFFVFVVRESVFRF